MTPQEKGEELIEKFYISKISTNKFRKEESRNCAIICVEEIIEQWEVVDVYLADGNGELNPNLRYWYEVKDYLINQQK